MVVSFIPRQSRSQTLLSFVSTKNADSCTIRFGKFKNQRMLKNRTVQESVYSVLTKRKTDSYESLSGRDNSWERDCLDAVNKTNLILADHDK